MGGKGEVGLRFLCHEDVREVLGIPSIRSEKDLAVSMNHIAVSIWNGLCWDIHFELFGVKVKMVPTFA